MLSQRDLIVVFNQLLSYLRLIRWEWGLFLTGPFPKDVVVRPWRELGLNQEFSKVPQKHVCLQQPVEFDLILLEVPVRLALSSTARQSVWRKEPGHWASSPGSATHPVGGSGLGTCKRLGMEWQSGGSMSYPTWWSSKQDLAYTLASLSCLTFPSPLYQYQTRRKTRDGFFLFYN